MGNATSAAITNVQILRLQKKLSYTNPTISIPDSEDFTCIYATAFSTVQHILPPSLFRLFVQAE